MSHSQVDTESLARLRAKASDALDELAGLRSHDPAAASAMRAVRLTRYTLEWFLLPTIDDLLM